MCVAVMIKRMYQVCRGDRRHEPSSMSLACHRTSDKGAEANAPRKCRLPKGTAPRVGGDEVRVWESLGERTASRCLHSKDGTATSAATQTSWSDAVAGFWLLALCMKLYWWEVACKSDILNEPIPFSVSRTFLVWEFSYYNAFVKRKHPFLEIRFSLHFFSYKSKSANVLFA